MFQINNIYKSILITSLALLGLIILRRFVLDFIFPRLKFNFRFKIPKFAFKLKFKKNKNVQTELPFSEEGTRKMRAEADQFFIDKKFKEAEGLYLELIEKMPFDGQIYSRLGIIYLALKQYNDARLSLEKSIQLGGNVSARYFNLALVYLKLNNKGKAKENIKKALELDSDNQKYQNLLAEILEKK